MSLKGKFRSGIDTQWEVMLILLTEPDNTKLTKAKIAERLKKSDTAIGNIAKDLHKDGYISIDTDYKIKGTSKQFLKLNTPNMLYDLVKNIANDEKTAEYYSNLYAILKRVDNKKDQIIDYSPYYESWKDLFADGVIKELVKKTPSVINSFILFFDLLLTLAKIDHSKVGKGSIGVDGAIKILLPIKLEILTTVLMTKDLFKLFIGIIQYDTEEFLKEVAKLSFTKKLRIWLTGSKYDFLGILPLIKELKIDLKLETETEKLNNRVMDTIYDYYKEYVLEKQKYLKQEKEEKKEKEFKSPSSRQLMKDLNKVLEETAVKKPNKLVDLSKKLSSFIWDEQKPILEVPEKIKQLKKEIDPNRKCYLTIPFKNGTVKKVPVKYDELIEIIG